MNWCKKWKISTKEEQVHLRNLLKPLIETKKHVEVHLYFDTSIMSAHIQHSCLEDRLAHASPLWHFSVIELMFFQVSGFIFFCFFVFLMFFLCENGMEDGNVLL